VRYILSPSAVIFTLVLVFVVPSPPLCAQAPVELPPPWQRATSLPAQTDATQSPVASGQPATTPGAPPPEVSTARQDLWHRKYLLGDYGGERRRLGEKGVKFGYYYIADALGNPFGERADFGARGRIRATMDLDFSKFTRWQGLTFHITGVWQYGTDLSKQYTLTAVEAFPARIRSAATPFTSSNICSTISWLCAAVRLPPTTPTAIPNMALLLSIWR
jgi:hypothetical protein